MCYIIIVYNIFVAHNDINDEYKLTVNNSVSTNVFHVYFDIHFPFFVEFHARELYNYLYL